ncbi:unnamed protein product [Arabis nemorensis]|uniref:Uncharacterized protein n=1 Tax=Arabis nemorensis TaxID=586526 RepID=A0A565C078_9BRAS|nr:unnamed protein product [Arabis nemorensis]
MQGRRSVAAREIDGKATAVTDNLSSVGDSTTKKTLTRATNELRRIMIMNMIVLPPPRKGEWCGKRSFTKS